MVRETSMPASSGEHGPTRARPKVFVLEPYAPHGGTLMAYHLARIVHEDFGYDGVAVGTTDPDHGVFDYNPVFPSIGIDRLPHEVGADDVLIANPSFSDLGLGLSCRGRKIMYTQGFNTFKLLDLRFDLRVSVSGFVQRVMQTTYGLETPVIHPFIDVGCCPEPPPWSERPALATAVVLKGDGPAQHLMLQRLSAIVATEIPGATLDVIATGGRPHSELLGEIGGYRHLLTLSASEGFGLVPLEAMAMGLTVLGFDGYGGRDFMRPGVNCAVVPHPDIEGVAARLIEVLRDPGLGAALAEEGRRTALSAHYARDRFAAEWRAVLTPFLAGRAP